MKKLLEKINDHMKLTEREAEYELSLLAPTQRPKWFTVMTIVMAAAGTVFVGALMWAIVTRPDTPLMSSMDVVRDGSTEGKSSGITKLPPPDCNVTPCWPHLHPTEFVVMSLDSGFETYDKEVIENALDNPIAGDKARIGHPTIETNVDVIAFRSTALLDESHDGASHRLVAPQFCYVYPTTELRELGAEPDGDIIAEIIGTPNFNPKPGDKTGSYRERACHGAVTTVGLDWSTW